MMCHISGKQLESKPRKPQKTRGLWHLLERGQSVVSSPCRVHAFWEDTDLRTQTPTFKFCFFTLEVHSCLPLCTSVSLFENEEHCFYLMQHNSSENVSLIHIHTCTHTYLSDNVKMRIHGLNQVQM